MVNGFYDLTGLKTKQQLRAFYLDAILLSYDSNVQTKDRSYTREIDKTKSLDYALSLVGPDTHNVCTDRSLYSPTLKMCKNEREVGFCTIASQDEIFLYCHLSPENFDKLIAKYNLQLIDY